MQALDKMGRVDPLGKWRVMFALVISQAFGSVLKILTVKPTLSPTWAYELGQTLIPTNELLLQPGIVWPHDAAANLSTPESKAIAQATNVNNFDERTTSLLFIICFSIEFFPFSKLLEAKIRTV